jgi:hypothetical protein
MLPILLPAAGAELRTHFHVPVYFREHAGLYSTADSLTSAFLQESIRAGVSAYELETYTYDVLPAALKTKDPVSSIVAEYQWILERFKNDPA